MVRKEMKPVRQLALEILSTWESQTTDISAMLNRVIRREKLSDVDKALLTELVYGVLRWRGKLDYIIKNFAHSSRALDRLTANILRLGAYQLIITDKIPPYAAINETVELAKPHRGRVKFANAVLRAIQRNQSQIEYPDKSANPIKYISVMYSYPEWMVERWIQQYDIEWTTAFCEASNQVAPLSVRTNTLRTNKELLIESLKQEGVTASYSEIVPEGLRLHKYPTLTQLSAYQHGWFQVQDDSSMLATYILDPQPGEVIIDVCAAPGGKTTHIAQLMQNQGKIYAFDISDKKLSRVIENCHRLGIDIVEPMAFDAREVLERFIEKADRVIADVPCSNLGVLRRHPDIRWNRSPEQITELAELQRVILTNASRYVKPNGILVYSTCSTEPEENEQVVMRFLSECPDFEIENASPFLPCEIENLVSETGYMQAYPHLHDMDGFFVARMEKDVIS